LSLVGAANLSAGKRLVAKIVFSLQTPVGVLTLASLGPIKRLIAVVFLSCLSAAGEVKNKIVRRQLLSKRFFWFTFLYAIGS
jgi:hypothetical protein